MFFLGGKRYNSYFCRKIKSFIYIKRNYRYEE